MPTKNVYVSDANVALFDKAAELAGGLSSAIVAGLQLYVTAWEKENEKGPEMREIELDVDEGPIVTTKRFVGIRILRYELRADKRMRSFRIYRTAKEQYAVYTREEPDWTALSGPGANDPAWEAAETWNAPWWRTGERSLRVFPTLTSMDAELPRAVTEALAEAERQPAVEELDI